MSAEARREWLRELLEAQDAEWERWIERRADAIQEAVGREIYLKMKGRRADAVGKAIELCSSDVAPLLLDLTPERFLRWMKYVDLPDLASTLAKANDEQRRRLSKPVEQALKNAFDKRNLAVAAYALCGYGVVKRLQIWDPKQRTTDTLFEIFAQRRPEWLEKWVTHQLEIQSNHFALIRRLIRAGLCEKPESENYFRVLIQSGAGRFSEGMTLIEALRADPELIDDALKAFELDPPDGVVFADWNRYADAREAERLTWNGALVLLLAEGLLDRGRLLTATFASLRARVQLRGTAFYLKLLEQCSLTPEETEAHEADYLDLLSHPVSAVVKYALATISLRIKSGGGDERYLRALCSVFEAEPKGNALAAIRLLRALGKKQKHLRSAVAVTAAQGLQHGNPSVQEKALDVVEEFWDRQSPEPREALRAYVELVAATNRARLATLLGDDLEETTPAVDQELGELLQAARSVPSELAELAGIPSLIAAWEAGTAPVAFQPDPRVRRLSDDSPVNPIESLDELIDCLLAAMEDREDAVGIERCLDGISRHADERPTDFEARTSALLKSATSGEHYSQIALDLAELVACWVRRQPKPRERDRRRDWFSTFFALRTQEIAQRAKNSIPAATLSLPTHSRGWIAPEELVRRLRVAQRDDVKFMRADFVQALLRLAPDGREAALSGASDLTGEMGQALRYALGGDFEGIGGHPDYWAAAARARYITRDAPELRGTAADVGPLCAVAARYQWELKRRSQSWATKDEHLLRVAVDPEPTPFSGEEYFLATTMLRDADKTPGYSSALPLDARLRAMAWPSCVDGAFWCGAHAITDRLFRPAAALMATATYLEPLFDPDLAFDEPARVCLALALIAQDADARTMGADVLTALMEDGRCDGDDLGEIYLQMFRTTDGVRLSRLAESLSRVQVAGPTQQWASARCLETLIVGWNALPKDAHHVLELLAELHTALGRPCPAPLCAILSTIQGSGKAAKAARRIVSQAGNAGVPPAVAAQLLRSRLERAQRWEAGR